MRYSINNEIIKTKTILRISICQYKQFLKKAQQKYVKLVHKKPFDYNTVCI